MKRGSILPIVLIITGCVIGAGLMFAYFQLKSKPTTIQPSKPPQATPVDQTVNWKTYTAGDQDIGFGLKYPPNFRVIKPNVEQSAHIISNMPSILGNFRNGDILITISLSDFSQRRNVQYQDSTFAGLKSKKGSGEDNGGGVIHYYVDNQLNISCDFYPSSDIELRTICDQILSTFQFLD